MYAEKLLVNTPDYIVGSHVHWFHSCRFTITDRLKYSYFNSKFVKKGEDYLYISQKEKEMSLLSNKRTLLHHPDTVFSYDLSSTGRDIIFVFTNAIKCRYVYMINYWLPTWNDTCFTSHLWFSFIAYETYLNVYATYLNLFSYPPLWLELGTD